MKLSWNIKLIIWVLVVIFIVLGIEFMYYSYEYISHQQRSSSDFILQHDVPGNTINIEIQSE